MTEKRKVKFIGSSVAQVNWGANDDPYVCGLVEGEEYTLESVEVHKWHTKYYLVEFPGKKFNSAAFKE